MIKSAIALAAAAPMAAPALAGPTSTSKRMLLGRETTTPQPRQMSM